VLQEQQRRRRNAFQNAPIGMALAGLDGRFLEVNRALSQLLGYSEEQLSMTTIVAITHPHDVEGMWAGTRQLLAGETTRFQAEQRYLHADGRVGHALVSISLISDLNGRPLHYVLGMDDTTPRQKSERLQAIPFAVTRMLAEAPALEAVSRRILERLCEDLDWQVGQLWIRDREDDVLRLRDFWQVSSLEVGANGINPESMKEEPSDNSMKVADASDKWDGSQKFDASDKSHASQTFDASDKWDASQTFDASDKSDASQKFDASDKWDASQKLPLFAGARLGGGASPPLDIPMTDRQVSHERDDQYP
jgi:PAS domain S-box-containing protein